MLISSVPLSKNRSGRAQILMRMELKLHSTNTVCYSFKILVHIFINYLYIFFGFKVDYLFIADYLMFFHQVA